MLQKSYFNKNIIRFYTDRLRLTQNENKTKTTKILTYLNRHKRALF